MSFRNAWRGVAALALFALVPMALRAQDMTKDGQAMSAMTKRLINVDADQIAIKGYDPIAYFVQQKPLKGSSARARRRSTTPIRPAIS